MKNDHWNNGYDEKIGESECIETDLEPITADDINSAVTVENDSGAGISSMTVSDKTKDVVDSKSEEIEAVVLDKNENESSNATVMAAKSQNANMVENIIETVMQEILSDSGTSRENTNGSCSNQNEEKINFNRIREAGTENIDVAETDMHNVI